MSYTTEDAAWDVYCADLAEAEQLAVEEALDKHQIVVRLAREDLDEAGVALDHEWRSSQDSKHVLNARDAVLRARRLLGTISPTDDDKGLFDLDC